MTELTKKYKMKLLKAIEKQKKEREMKRYVVTVDLYIYADTDEEVKEKAQKFTKDAQYLVDGTENRASVVSIYESPFAKIGGLRKIV